MQNEEKQLHTVSRSTEFVMHTSAECLGSDHIYDKFDAGYVDEADVCQFSG